MRRFFYTIIVLAVYLSSCSHLDLIKLTPEYKGVDPEFQGYVKEYKDLAQIHDITFNKEVTMGFKKLKSDKWIGVCYYGLNFREIDIDTDYWQTMPAIQRTALVFHELTHCYCNRDHDYGKGDKYPEEKLSYYIQKLKQLADIKSDGYLDDGCPKSIMHPVIVDAYCMNHYYNYYIDEMFDRCEPY